MVFYDLAYISDAQQDIHIVLIYEGSLGLNHANSNRDPRKRVRSICNFVATYIYDTTIRNTKGSKRDTN
jgi:hypothetical protein